MRELGSTTYPSIKRRAPGKRVTGSGVLVALNMHAFRDYEVRQVVDVGEEKAMAVGLSG